MGLKNFSRPIPVIVHQELAMITHKIIHPAVQVRLLRLAEILQQVVVATVTVAIVVLIAVLLLVQVHLAQVVQVHLV